MEVRSPETVKLLLSSFVRQTPDKYSYKTVGAQTPDQQIDGPQASRERSASDGGTQPTDRTAFHARVATYKSEMWFGKPAWLSPPHCARYGWCNVGRDLLQCTSCKAFLSGKMPTMEDPQVFALCCDRLLSSLQVSHNRLCPWASYPSPESFLSPDLENRDEVLQDTRKRYSDLLSFQDLLPVISHSAATTLGLALEDLQTLTRLLSQSSLADTELCDVSSPVSVQDVMESQPASVDQETDCELSIQQEAALLAACGWSKRDGSLPQIQCEMCDRHMGLWFYHSRHSRQQPDQEEADSDTADTPPEAAQGRVESPMQPATTEHINGQSSGCEMEAKVDELQPQCYDSQLSEVEEQETIMSESGKDSTAEDATFDEEHNMEGSPPDLCTDDVPQDAKTQESPGVDAECHGADGEDLVLGEFSPVDLLSAIESQSNVQEADEDVGDIGSEIGNAQMEPSFQFGQSSVETRGSQSDDIIFYVDNVPESLSSADAEESAYSSETAESEPSDTVHDVLSEIVNSVAGQDTEAASVIDNDRMVSGTEAVNDCEFGEEDHTLTDSVEDIIDFRDVPQLDGGGDDFEEAEDPDVVDDEQSDYSDESDGSIEVSDDNSEESGSLESLHEHDEIQQGDHHDMGNCPLLSSSPGHCHQELQDDGENSDSSDDCVVIDSDDDDDDDEGNIAELQARNQPTQMICAASDFVPVEESEESSYHSEDYEDEEDVYSDEEYGEDVEEQFSSSPHQQINHEQQSYFIPTHENLEHDSNVGMQFFPSQHSEMYGAASGLVNLDAPQEEAVELLSDPDDESFASGQSSAEEGNQDVLTSVVGEVTDASQDAAHSEHSASQATIPQRSLEDSKDQETDVEETKEDSFTESLTPEPFTISESGSPNPFKILSPGVFHSRSLIPEKTVISECEQQSETVSGDSETRNRTVHSDSFAPTVSTEEQPKRDENTNDMSTEKDLPILQTKTAAFDYSDAAVEREIMSLFSGEAMDTETHRLVSPGVENQSQDVETPAVTGEDQFATSMVCSEELSEHSNSPHTMSDAANADSIHGEDATSKVQDSTEFNFVTDDTDKEQSSLRIQSTEETIDGHTITETERSESNQSSSLEDRSQSRNDVATELAVDTGATEDHEDAGNAVCAEMDREAVDMPQVMEESQATMEKTGPSDMDGISLKRKHSADEGAEGEVSVSPTNIQDQPQRKKHKLKVVRGNFCPVSEHRTWCPWVAMTTSEVGADVEGDRVVPGWRKLVDLLIASHSVQDSFMVQKSKITPPHNNLRSIRHILDQWTSQSTCVDQTTL